MRTWRALREIKKELGGINGKKLEPENIKISKEVLKNFVMLCVPSGLRILLATCSMIKAW